MKRISRRDALKYIGAGALGLAAVSGGLTTLTNCKANEKEKSVDRHPNPINGEKISLLGFGCMRFPTTGENEIDEELSQKMIDYAYAHGVNYYDTAWPYHHSTSETFIGKALKKYPRESFYLADKMPTWLVTDAAFAKKTFETQLEKCQVEYFDYYLLHSLQNRESYDKAYEETEAYNYLLEEKKAGRIKNLGFSFHGDKEFFEYLLAKHDWDFVQIQLNYYDWDTEDAKYYYNRLVEKNIPIIVMEPIRGGMLANLNPDAVSILKKAHSDWSPASWALKYVAGLPGILTVLSGMSAMDHVIDNVNSMSNFKALTEDDKNVLAEALRIFLQTKPIRCTACKYCMPCPFGVDIPENFAVYNKCVNNSMIPDIEHPDTAEFKKRRNAFLNDYHKIPEANRADRCRNCGKCRDKCPQHLPIPEELKRIADLVSALE